MAGDPGARPERSSVGSSRRPAAGAVPSTEKNDPDTKSPMISRRGRRPSVVPGPRQWVVSGGPAGGCGPASASEHEVDRGTGGIDGSVEVAPPTLGLMPLVTHDTRRYANNRAEVSHQPTRRGRGCPATGRAGGRGRRETSALHRMGTLAVHWGWLDTVPGRAVQRGAQRAAAATDQYAGAAACGEARAACGARPRGRGVRAPDRDPPHDPHLVAVIEDGARVPGLDRDRSRRRASGDARPDHEGHRRHATRESANVLIRLRYA